MKLRPQPELLEPRSRSHSTKIMKLLLYSTEKKKIKKGVNDQHFSKIYG
jgi:hypothetical protein